MVTLRMEEQTVLGRIRAAMRSPNKVVVVPSREFGDFLVADRTEAVLFFPEANKLASLSEIVHHFEAKSLLKVDFPSRVVRVGFAFDFSVSFDGRVGSEAQLNGLAVVFPEEQPVA